MSENTKYYRKNNIVIWLAKRNQCSMLYDSQSTAYQDIKDIYLFTTQSQTGRGWGKGSNDYWSSRRTHNQQ